MAKKKTNAKVVSKAKAPKAKKTTKRSKTSAKSAAKTELIKQTQTSVADATQENSNLESDLKISKFAKAPAVQETDEVVADDLMTLNQKLNQIFDKKQTELSSTDEPAPEPTKPKSTRINLEPVSAEMIEKSAKAQTTTPLASSTEERPETENPSEIEYSSQPDNSSDAQASTIEVHINKSQSEAASGDALERSDEEVLASEWEDELSDDVAEQLSSKLDEIDETIDQTPQPETETILDDDEPNLGAIILTNPEITESCSPPRHSRVRLWLSLLVVAILSGLALWRLAVYQHVSVNGQQFQTETDEQIVRQMIEQVKDRKIRFQMSNQPVVELRLGDAGIGVDAERLTSAIQAQRQLTISNLLFKSNIELPMLVDYPVLQSVLDDNFKEKLIQPTDAQLTYDKKQNLFLISQSSAGYRVDARRAVPDPNQILNRQDLIIAVEYQPSDPLVKELDLKTAETYLNERLKLRLNLNHDNKLLYFADPWDIADWVEFKTHPQTKKITIDFSKQKIQDFIEKTVSPQIARGVVNRKVLVNEQGQVVQVLQEGRRGLGAVDPGDSAELIRQALLNNQNIDINLNIKEIDFVEERLSAKGLKWVEVNLTKQTTTLYSGEQPLHSFVISSGVHPWPTPTGTYKVWFKNPIQRMQGGSREAGDYYNLPNVRWNTYFNRDIGFHTAYWHNNFGRPMSHGCINMREADAKVVYDFAPIGTMVVVKR